MTKFQHKRNVDAYKLSRASQLTYTDETKRSKVFYRVTWLCHEVSFDTFSLKMSPSQTPQSTICFTQPWFLTRAFGRPGMGSIICVQSDPTCHRDSVRVQETFLSISMSNGHLISKKFKVAA